MIKFGNIKSKIEEKLLESYSKNTFKSEMKNFKSMVLGNKNISKLFYLYDEMSSNKGLNESHDSSVKSPGGVFLTVISSSQSNSVIFVFI